MRGGEHQGPLYGVLVLFLTGLALAGYVGYVVYPRFDLPVAAGIGLLVLSAGAGFASFFSPCSFPLLITLLSRQTNSEADEQRSSNSSLRFASALAAGAFGFFLIAGALVALGAGVFFENVTFTSASGRILRLLVGAFLILLGLFQLNRLPSPDFRAVSRLSEPLSRYQARRRRQRPALGFALFGFGYPLAGFG
ncbi:hypothetical protein BH23ACT11_BH23ACT11_24770 [soil metagenome]